MAAVGVLGLLQGLGQRLEADLLSLSLALQLSDSAVGTGCFSPCPDVLMGSAHGA